MRLLPLLLVASGWLPACKPAAVPAAPALGSSRPFVLLLQQAATIPAGGGAVSLTLLDVKDARCPSGTQCIWAGYAAVTVQLTDASAAPQVAHISLLANALPAYTRDSATVTLNQKTYWLRLLEVNPYPGTDSGQPTTAKLRLRPA